MQSASDTPELARAPGPSRLGRAASQAGRTLGWLDVFTARIRPVWVLGPLVVAGWLVAGYVAHAAVHSGWLYYESGDATWYYTTAWMLGHGLLPVTNVGYGYPLLLAPFARIAGPSMLAGLPYGIVINVSLLGPLALLCVYGIAKILGGRRFAYVVSACWVFAPVVFIRYFLVDYHRRYVGLQLPANVGLTLLGDFPTMVALLVSAYFLFRTFESGDDLDVVAAGLAAGLALAIKPSSALYLPAAFLGLAVARRPRAFVAFGLTLAPTGVALALWKYRGYGYLPLFHSSQVALAAGTGPPSVPVGLNANIGHYLHVNWSAIMRNLDGFREFTWSGRLIEGAVIGGLIGLVRRSPPGAAFIGAWLTTFLIFKGSTVANFHAGSFFRYMAPAFPAAFALVMSLPFLVPVAGRRLANAGHLSPPSWPGTGKARRWVVGICAFLALAPLVPILLFGQQRGADTAAATHFWTLEPVNTFPLRAVVHGRTVMLSWPERQFSGTHVEYGIFRYPASARMISCPPPGAGATECLYLPWYTTLTRENHFRDTPGRGKWRYRIAVVAGVPPPPSDVIELSRETDTVWIRTGPGPKPPPPPPPKQRAYCVQGNFEMLPIKAHKGATPALFVLGTGLTCAAPPEFVHKGFATAEMGVESGVYPLYVPPGN